MQHCDLLDPVAPALPGPCDGELTPSEGNLRDSGHVQKGLLPVTLVHVSVAPFVPMGTQKCAYPLGSCQNRNPLTTWGIPCEVSQRWHILFLGFIPGGAVVLSPGQGRGRDGRSLCWRFVDLFGGTWGGFTRTPTS